MIYSTVQNVNALSKLILESKMSESYKPSKNETRLCPFVEFGYVLEAALAVSEQNIDLTESAPVKTHHSRIISDTAKNIPADMKNAHERIINLSSSVCKGMSVSGEISDAYCNNPDRASELVCSELIKLVLKEC